MVHWEGIHLSTACEHSMRRNQVCYQNQMWGIESNVEDWTLNSVCVHMYACLDVLVCVSLSLCVCVCVCVCASGNYYKQ